MAWVKRNDNKITGEYSTRQELVHSFPLRKGEVAVEVFSIQDYKNEIAAWVFSKKENKPIKIKRAWDYSELSIRAKDAIKKAIEQDDEESWMQCLGIYISEKWASDYFCCKGHIPDFKEKVLKMIADESR